MPRAACLAIVMPDATPADQNLVRASPAINHVKGRHRLAAVCNLVCVSLSPGLPVGGQRSETAGQFVVARHRLGKLTCATRLRGSISSGIPASGRLGLSPISPRRMTGIARPRWISHRGASINLTVRDHR